MSLVLTSRNNGDGSKTLAMGGLWMSVIWVISLTLQAIVGLTLIRIYNQTTSDESLSDYLGMIVTHGFTQGPGQAIALGNLWEKFVRRLARDRLWFDLRLTGVRCSVPGWRPSRKMGNGTRVTCQPSAAGR